MKIQKRGLVTQCSEKTRTHLPNTGHVLGGLGDFEETSSRGTKISSTRQPQGTSQRQGPVGKVAWGQERQAANGKRWFFFPP